MTIKNIIMLHLKRTFFLVIFILLINVSLYAVKYTHKVEIQWNSVQAFTNENDGSNIARMNFSNAVYNNSDNLPYFYYAFNIHSTNIILENRLINCIYENVTDEEFEFLYNIGFDNTEFEVLSRVQNSRNQPIIAIQVLPIRYNMVSGKYEKLLSFEIDTEIEDKEADTRLLSEYANSSVLATGNWFKIKLNKNGVYKITYSELELMGFDMSSSPANFAVYGNGGAMLPEKNNSFRYDDLVENPILIVGGEDGKWDQGDYALFYGEGPVTWTYSPLLDRFYHNTNYYRDYTYYFITTKSDAGLRVSNQEAPSQSHEIEINQFTDYIVHQLTLTNIAGVGRTWYGETFDYNLDYYYDYDFPNIIRDDRSATFNVFVAAKSYASNSFSFYINNEFQKSLRVSTISSSSRYDYGKSANTSFKFTPDDDQLVVHLEYNRSLSSSVGYLNYFEINVQRKLTFTGDQMQFRKYLNDDISTVKYNLSNADNSVIIWDVTNPVFAEKVVTQAQSDVQSFKAEPNRDYIAFKNNGSFLSTEFVGKVPNQNLHGYRNIDYIIVTHPDFLEQANNLADFHRSFSDLDVLVATTEQVYNEFSSGGQDISAIRDFAKMLYDDSEPGKELRYLLLFGDASYDYKDVLSNNTNFVPCWESVASLNIVSSIASDDYFGFLDDGEGVESAKDLVDIGIGRFVVATVDEAEMAVNKTISYSENSDSNMGAWRNIVTFIADDGDNNIHINDAEGLASLFDTSNKVYNISKIYLDAYEQVSTPSGQRAPEVNKAINDRIAKGTLIFNYSGHGGEIGLSHEQIVQVQDINSWTNYDNLTVFITATCEFTRYDDPMRVSAGEYVFLNAKGGGIALFTTTRATYANANYALNRAIYNDNMFKKIDGEFPAFGDIIRKSKIYGTDNDRKFILVGDPACKMVYPDFNTETVEINSNLVLPNYNDTIKALQLVKIKGVTVDDNGDKLDTFNGELYTSIYDKESEIQTFGDESPVYTFNVRNNVLFNGRAAINNGEFEFEFMVPKDIAYKYGFGKISYYFRDEDDESIRYDGNGYYDKIVVGGFDTTAVVDDEGPEISLFLNDTTFLSGDIVNQNPNLLAFVKDSSGINTTGIGIGHDIVTILNEDKEMTYVLNDYYEASENKYNEGKIIYPFSDLPEGKHSLSFKVWDVYNNSSTAYLDFEVVSSTDVIIDKLKNYPNPFMDETNFVFSHNQKGYELDVTFEIFSLDGRKVRSMKTTFTPEATQTDPVTWDGKSDNGGQISAGFYLYRVIVKNENGDIGTETSKLIYVK